MRCTNESCQKSTPALQVIPIRRWRSRNDTIEIIRELQSFLSPLSTTCGASEVVRFVLWSAVVMFNDLFTDDGFDVDCAEGEVVDYLGVV